MNDKRISAACADAILRLAVIENHKRELDAIPSREELEKMYSFSSEHEVRMKKLFVREQRKETRKKTFAVIRRAVAVIIIAITLLSCILLTNAEVRAAVRETIIEWFEKYTRFTFAPDTSVDENAEWYPSYLPEGFVETGRETLGGTTFIDYEDSFGNAISLRSSPAVSATLSVDNENREYKLVFERGIEYNVFGAISKDYTSIITWERDGFNFDLESSIDSEELIKTAVSVER